MMVVLVVIHHAACCMINADDNPHCSISIRTKQAKNQVRFNHIC
jgi:hypothetical protein